MMSRNRHGQQVEHNANDDQLEKEELWIQGRQGDRRAPESLECEYRGEEQYHYRRPQQLNRLPHRHRMQRYHDSNSRDEDGSKESNRQHDSQRATGEQDEPRATRLN